MVEEGGRAGIEYWGGFYGKVKVVVVVNEAEGLGWGEGWERGNVGGGGSSKPAGYAGLELIYISAILFNIIYTVRYVCNR